MPDRDINTMIESELFAELQPPTQTLGSTVCEEFLSFWSLRKYPSKICSVTKAFAANVHVQSVPKVPCVLEQGMSGGGLNGAQGARTIC